MTTVAVIGGGGFLGRRVCGLLEEAGHAASPLSRRNGCDLLDGRGLRDRLRSLRPAAVINCAAHVGSLHYVSRRAADVIHDNTLMIAGLYAAHRDACPDALLVNPVSSCSYPGETTIQVEGEWQRGPVHESVLAFGTTRRLLHAFASSYARQHGTRTVNWILPNAYGPGDATDPDRVHALNGILIRLLQALKQGRRTLEIWGSGRPVREWIYVDDAARILVRSIGMEPQIEPVNVAQKRGYSIAEIATLAAEVLGEKMDFVFNTRYPDGAPSKVLDDALFRSRCPDFRFTPLRDGIAATLDYYRSVLQETA